MNTTPLILQMAGPETSQNLLNDTVCIIKSESCLMIKPDDIHGEMLGGKMIAMELNKAPDSCAKGLHQCDGSDSGHDYMNTTPLILQMAGPETSQNLLNDTVCIIKSESCLMIKPDDIHGEMLGGKMIAMELNKAPDSCAKGLHQCDGSDSGVDIATTLNICLQRAFSSNSGEYASSSGGIDMESNLHDNLSCGSSMISCTSDLGERKLTNTNLNEKINYECYSENGSESSSVAVCCIARKQNNVKKKIGLFDTPSTNSSWKSELSPSSSTAQLNKVRSRMPSALQAKSGSPSVQNRERARSHDKAEKTFSKAPSKNTTPFRSTAIKRTPKPDSLPCALNSTFNIHRTTQRTTATTGARTPGTPSDDGRWPSVGNKTLGSGLGAKRGSSVTPDLGSFKLRGQVLMSSDSKCGVSSANFSNTLPRRRKQKSVEDLRGRASRSSSNSRENGAASLIKKNVIPTHSTTKSRSPLIKMSYRKATSKTRIYHELAVQTVMTAQDVEKAFTGNSYHIIPTDSAEFVEKQTQSDIRDMEMERLREEVQKLICKQAELAIKLEEKTKKVSIMEQQIDKEREEKISVQRELNQNTERVIGMIELSRHAPSGESSCDSLMMLQSQIQMSGHELVEKQEEIMKLRRLCRSLQNQMERALVAQECLMQEKNSMEREASEMHDFLQNEKTAMCDALNESEFEYQNCKKALSEKEEEVKVLRDECRHLVRLNEQRRQENKLLQSKYTVLEFKSNELSVQQGTALSGASMALSALHTRLDSLVEQLISSYNISEQDLEDIAYHNEAYQNNASSCDETPEYEKNINGQTIDQKDGSLSPQRNQSFIAAVISAIRNATAPSGKKRCSFHGKPSYVGNEDESDSTEMLDSETEPCLMMDNVLEDVTMPDSHSHNMVSSTGIVISQMELPTDLIRAGDDSLNNLSQAITNRQQIELQINSSSVNTVNQFGKSSEKSFGEDVSFHESVAEMPSIVNYCSTQALVDQVVEVDNLITKLLKVLRLIQMDNDICIQQLIVDKNKLQQNKEDMLEKLKDFQDINIKLQDELMDATQELMLKSTDLNTTKSDIQRHRNEIDRLNEDICQLSTLCSQNNSKCHSLEQEETPEAVLQMLEKWNEQGHFAREDVQNYLTNICAEKCSHIDDSQNFEQKVSNVLNENSIQEMHRQHEAIDNALRVLNKLENIVQDNPTLQQLQADLEKTNFQSLSTLPLYTSLLRSQSNTSQDLINANDLPVNIGNFSCDNSGNQTQINSPV